MLWSGCAIRLAGLFALSFVLSTSPAHAQGGRPTASIGGTVVDEQGHPIPAVEVWISDPTPGRQPGALVPGQHRSQVVLTDRHGRFGFLALAPGVYDVLTAPDGYVALAIRDVSAVGPPRDLKIVLRHRPVSSTETEERRGGDPALTGAPMPREAIVFDAEDLERMPLPRRHALNAIGFLPGVSVPTTVRSASILGLPTAAVAITLDGVGAPDDLLKSASGNFSRVTPYVDFVSAMIVPAPVTDVSAAQGAAQLQFVTRSGSSRFSGSVFDDIHATALNSNAYFNQLYGLSTNADNLQEYGATAGGPIAQPSAVFGAGRAFFFGGISGTTGTIGVTRRRTILTPAAQAGALTYTSTSGALAQVNLLKLAGQNGLLSTPDPTVAALLAQVQSDVARTGVTFAASDPNTLNYVFENPGRRTDVQPVLRLDVDVATHHRLTGTFNHRGLNAAPDFLNATDPSFPGEPNARATTSGASSGSVAWRWIGRSFANEVVVGGTTGDVTFGPVADQFANQQGFALSFSGFPAANPLSNITASNGTVWRSDNLWTLDEAMRWTKGAHSFTVGANVSRETAVETTQVMAAPASLTGNLGVASLGSRVPSANNAVQTDAQNLYQILTGYVSVGGTARLDETGRYNYLGPFTVRARGQESALYGGDTWRLRSNLTLDAGLRWDVQAPVVSGNDVLPYATLADVCGLSGIGNGPGGRGCNFFQPGVVTGSSPSIDALAPNARAYETDWNNVAPSVSVAWRPSVSNSVVRAILGDPARSVVRSGYSVAYQRNGLQDVLGVYEANPGTSRRSFRGCGGFDFEPCLLRSAIPPAMDSLTGVFPSTPAYPLTPTVNDSVNAVEPKLQTPYARVASIGLERSLGRSSTLGVRYVGTRGRDQWTIENWDEVNVLQNGFLAEFQQAQVNLQANLRAGRGATFVYEGPNTGTGPLPIYLQYLTLQSPSKATDPKAYLTTSSWSNARFVNQLSLTNPNPLGAAAALSSGLAGGASFFGVVPNLFVINSDVASANVLTNNGRTSYDALEITFNGAWPSLRAFATFTAARQRVSVLDTITRAPFMAVGPNGTPRAFTVVGSYDVPYGRGLRHGTDLSPWLDAVIGHWSADVSSRVQTGQVLRLSGVRLVGMTPEDLQQAFRIRVDPSTKMVYDLPQDIIDNTIRAFSTDATSLTGYGSLGAPTGRYIAPASTPTCVEVYPGDCGEPHDVTVTGPVVSRVNVSARKSWPAGRHARVEMQLMVLNVFAAINFTPVLQASASPTIDQVTSAYQDVPNTFDPGGRTGQLVVRVKW